MNAASQNASPKWSDVAADESFQRATPEVRQQVRDQFFSKVVEPATPEALRGEVREKFYSQTAGDIGGQGGLAMPEEQLPAESQQQDQPQRPQGGQQRPSGLAMPNHSEEERNAAWEAAWKAEGVQNPQQDTGVNIDVSKANADSNLLTDAGNLLAIGADKMALNFREATRQVLGENVVNALDRVDEFLNGKSSEDLLSDRIEHNESQITDATQAAQQKQFITEDEDGNYQLGPAWKDPRTYFAGITESLPEMAATMAPSTLLAKAAYGYRLARGATRAQAAASAARTATAAGALSEGALGGAAASRDVREAIESMPDEMLRESDAIQMLMLEGKTFDEAKKTITEDLQSQTFMVAGAITGAFGGAGDRFLAKLLTEGGSGRFAAMLRGGVAEGLLEEAPQEGGQQIAKNRALGVVDDSVGTFDDVPNAMAGGAAIGGVMGGGLGLAGGGPPALPQDEAPGATPSAEAAPESAPDVADADVVDRVTSDLDLLRSNRRDLDDAGRERRDSLIDGDAYKELRARAEDLGMDEAVIELEQARRVAGEAFEQETLAAQSGSQESMEAARSLSTQAADRLQSALVMMRGGPQSQADTQSEPQMDPKAEPEASRDEAPEVEPAVNRAQSDIGNRIQIAQDGLADLGRAARRSGYQAETRTRTADQLLRRARQAFEAGRADEAERLLSQADRQAISLRRDLDRPGTTESPARATGEYESDRPVGLLGMDGRRLNAPDDVIYAEGPAVDRTEYEAPARKVRRDEELQRQAAARRKADQDLQARAQSDQPLLDDAGIVYGEGPARRRGNANTGLDMPSSSDPRYVQDQLDRAAQETDVNPTPAQAEAGNYRKGRVNFNGVDIAIENPRGSTRRGKDADGTAWESTLAHHYGDIKGTKGADGDNIDVFIGENLDSPKVYVVDQVDRDGNFDEHKVMMGFRNETEARRGYQGNYPKGWNGIDAVTELTPQQFKEWIRDADTTLPVGEVVNRDSAGMGTQANTGSDRAGDTEGARDQDEDSVARPEKRSPQGDVSSGTKRRQRGVTGERQAEAAAESETDQQDVEVDREQAQQQAEQADTDARRQEQQRAQADRDIDDFVLAGSDLPADQAVSRGQNPLFSFAGSRASNADLHALERAQRMLENGQDPEAIRQETGWFEGVDGKWRFEIDDSDARFLPFVDKSAGTQWTKPLEEVIDHPRLFAAYPMLRDVSVVSVIGMGRKRGRYVPKRREITLNAELDPMEQFSTLLHEVQHGIQHIEGFASGGSPENYRLPPRREQWLRNKIQELTRESGDFAREVLEQYKAGELTSDQVQQRIQQRADEIGLNELRKKLSEGNERGAYRYYQRLYGETEARNVQARQGMSEVERRDTSPAETQDVPDSEVVVVYNGLEMAGAPGPANARATAATNGPAITQAKDIAAALEGVKELSDTRVIQATQELPPSALVGMALRGIDPADVRGMYIGGDLYVIADNVGSIKEGVQTAVHEAVGHKGIRAVLGEELAPSMLSLYHSLPKSRRGREALEEVRRDYPFLDPAKREDRITIGEEMVAHLLEKGYRPKAWQRAVAKLRELLRRLFPSIAWTYGDVLALGEKSRDHLRRQQAERNSAQAKRTITRYSKRKTENPLLTPIRHEAEIYRRDLNKAMSSKHSKVSPIRMGRTPPVLASLGAPDLPISITRDVVNKATSAKHHVSMETIQRLPELLHDPVAILDSRTSQDALVVLVNAVDAKGKAVLVPIHLNKRQQYIHVNRVASVYGKDGAQRFVERGIEEGRVRYVNTRKSPEWLQSSRLQLPGEGAPSRGFDKSVLTPDDIVNQAQRYAMAPSPSPVGAYSDNDSTNFSLPDEALVGKALRVLTDKMRPLNKLQEAITKHGGRVTQDNDVYLAEELFHGKAEHDLRQIRERYVERLAEGMAQSGISQEALDEYLYARHAPERNARIAERNPGDPRYSDGGSGMKTQDALDILDRINSGAKRAEFERLASIVDDMLRTQREAIREGGLETDETLDAWEASYRYYVPLKGFAEDDKADPGRPRIGRGFEIKGKESKTALGRLSRADSPSTQAIVDTTQAIIRRRKNEVGNALLSLVTDNPNPDLWQVYTNDNPDTQRVRVTVKDPVTGRDKVEVRERPIAMEGDERYFKTKKAGRTFYIKIKDERLMNAMRNVGPEKNGMIVNAMGAVTRLMASLVTSYNPEFMLTNFARDVQTALLNLQAEQSKANGKIRGKRIVRQTMRDLRPAMAAAYRGLSSRQGKTPKARQWDRYFQEFMEDGAKTGYFDMKDIQGQAKEISSMMRRASGGTIGSALVFRKKTADFVENINGAVENASRLSAYVNARRAGVSRKKAASLAKNMTVNFNRRGELGSMFNAFYMFFNASVQGTRNFARTMVGLREVDEDTSRANVWARMNTAQRTALAMAAGSFLLAMVNRSLSEEDDDGELFWDKIPAHEKERNLIFMTGDKDYVKIPLPYGYNVFSVLGTQAEAAARGGKPFDQVAIDTVLAILGSFSPIGFEGSEESVNAVAKNITPTLFRSITQVAVNEDFAGRPVYKENLPFGTPKPDSTLAFRSNPDAYQGFTRFLNERTGGSDYRSGGIDISPEVLQHIVNFYGGGAWGFAEKTGDFVHRLTTGEDVERYRVPFAGRFASNVSEYGDIQHFYERRDEVGQIAKEFENLTLDEVENYYVEYGPMIELFDLAKDVEENLTALREVRDIIEADESLTAVERQERLKELEEVMDAEVDYFNLEYRLAKESL
ncbi:MULTISPECIES: LPD38 domain-containing protein [Halomonas]|uniref:LPD38 domain-containing protein n=1 Tax=Halomonas TaxID=2745 RepID=UPI001C93DC5E|nr:MULTISPECIES: LPD38 domain-containing protein [Halomonas]MBY6209102.1 hypothetical protein [Halomonas sp. DP3Y7-2]MBY6229258.1 hypothetical protein [Halomonas sp. DP3Y7-1]MCA0917679.1 hypothetical protein [Halomonas denitrificans]